MYASRERGTFFLSFSNQSRDIPASRHTVAIEMLFWYARLEIEFVTLLIRVHNFSAKIIKNNYATLARGKVYELPPLLWKQNSTLYPQKNITPTLTE